MPMADWIFQWPTMISYCAMYINWTTETENAIREGKLQVNDSNQ